MSLLWRKAGQKVPNQAGTSRSGRVLAPKPGGTGQKWLSHNNSPGHIFPFGAVVFGRLDERICKNTLIRHNQAQLGTAGKTHLFVQMVDRRALALNCREKAQNARQKAWLERRNHKVQRFGNVLVRGWSGGVVE
jgi:hypothetical protein